MVEAVASQNVRRYLKNAQLIDFKTPRTRKSPLTLPGNTGELLRHTGNKGDRERDPRARFRANSSSPAVRVRYGVVVGPANHGTGVEFLPGFPAL